MNFEQAYEAHFRYVWRVLRGLGVPEADTADAAQEVFLVVHRKLAETARAPLPALEVKARVRARVEQLAASGAPKISVDRGRVEVEFRRPGAHTPAGLLAGLTRSNFGQ